MNNIRCWFSFLSAMLASGSVLADGLGDNGPTINKPASLIERVQMLEGRMDKVEALFGKNASIQVGQSGDSWQQYVDNKGFYIDIAFDKPFVGGVPRIFTSLRGASHHWEVSGTTSIYCSASNGFRVYIRHGSITAAFAKQHKYRIDYIAIGGKGNWVSEISGSGGC